MILDGGANAYRSGTLSCCAFFEEATFFFAINNDKAKEVKEAFQKELNKMEEQKKIIEEK